MVWPAALHLLADFAEFLAVVAERRAKGDVQEQIIHRIREEWMRWWLGLAPERRDEMAERLGGLKKAERKWFLQQLRSMVEADCEREGGEPDSPDTGEWVFMQLAHVAPFEESGIFADWRLEKVHGFRALCLHPDRSFPILVRLLKRGPNDKAHYVYNAELANDNGALNAKDAVVHLLKGNPFFFAGRPRGWVHQPAALRHPLTLSLIVGLSCMAAIYITEASGYNGEMLIGRLFAGVYLSAILFVIFWFISVGSDWWVGRRLAKLLDKSQVAWAFGDRPPGAYDRNPLTLFGGSYSAPLALSILDALARHAETQGMDSWILWHIRRAARKMDDLGITGVLSSRGKEGRVDGLKEKKQICLREGRVLLAPDQEGAAPTPSEAAAGLEVIKCRNLRELIRAAAFGGSGSAKRGW